jgi:hypothetical protein
VVVLEQIVIEEETVGGIAQAGLHDAHHSTVLSCRVTCGNSSRLAGKDKWEARFVGTKKHIGLKHCFDSASDPEQSPSTVVGVAACAVVGKSVALE